MKKVMLWMVLVAACGTAASQNREEQREQARERRSHSRLFFGVDYGYRMGISERAQGDSYAPEGGRSAHTLSVQAGYFVAPRWALAVGFGLGNYDVRGGLYGVNVTPLYLEASRFFATDHHGWFLSAKAGAMIPHDPDYYKTGLLAGAEAGYRLPLGGRWKIDFSLGYELMSVRNPEFYAGSERVSYHPLSRHSLALGVGILF